MIESQRSTSASGFAGILARLDAAPRTTILYDYSGVRATVRQLAEDLANAFPNHLHSIRFSIKANSHPPLLRAFANLGIGAEIASFHELEHAQSAGMQPICATSPAFSAAQTAFLVAQGVEVNIDSLHQLDQLEKGARVGLRLRMSWKEDSTRRQEGISRFGLDPADPKVVAALERTGVVVVGVHGHSRDIGTADQMNELALILRDAAARFPNLQKINLGGGMTRIYRDRNEARRGWALVGATLAHVPMRVQFAVEPGAQVITDHGYLGTRVLAASSRPDGRQLVIVDASPFNLVTWSRVELLHPLSPESGGLRTDLVGPTCYENDVWCTGIELPQLKTGDLLVWRGLGAYVASMSRRLHDLDPPDELLC